MKKLVVIAALATAVVSVSAAELGVRGNHGPDSNGYGLTLSERSGPIGVELGLDHFHGDYNKLGVVGSHDLLQFGRASIAAKAGISAINPIGSGSTGVAAQLGLGVDYVLTDRWALVGDVYWLKAQRKIDDADGGYASIGVKYRF